MKVGEQRLQKRTRMIEPPQITFSKWAPWDKRECLRSRDGKPSMGVYLWAHFHQAPDATRAPSVSDDALCRALRAYTRYVEDLIYWKYVEAFGKRAALDYKKKPNRSTVAKCCPTGA